MAKRFIIAKRDININNSNISVYGNELNHINALRYKREDKIYINEYMIEIINISKDLLEGKIIGLLNEKGEPKVAIDIYVGYLKSDKMHYLVQKSVELGIKNIIPIITKNTVVKFEEKDKINKKEKLQKIVIEAIGQCGRTDDVIVNDIKDISDIYDDMANYDLVIVCHEKGKENIRNVLYKIDKKNINKIAIVIGPEGGLANEEVKNISKTLSAKTVNLGERILRAETAVNYILSIVDYEFNS